MSPPDATSTFGPPAVDVPIVPVPATRQHDSRQNTRAFRSVADVPLSNLLGIEVSPEPGATLSLSHQPCLSNHIGTMHAGALMTLAEAASAEFLLRRFGARKDVVPLLRRFEAKFCAVAKGTISAKAGADEQALERFERDLAARGAGLVSVKVQLYDEAGTRVLDAEAKWFAGAREGRT